ncbi:MAG: ISAs1 family transposase [Angustibacter sp.]
MPASSVSPIVSIVDQLVGVVAGVRVGPGRLLEVLAGVPDPRAARGVRHDFTGLLVAALCAVMAGARSYVAMGEWASDVPAPVLALIGLRSAPDESTFRRALQVADVDALDALVGAWAASHTRPAPTGWRRVSVDGKTLRGSTPPRVAGRPTGAARHVLAAYDHDHGVVLGQVNVPHKTNEIALFATLLDRIDLTRTIVTADAFHTQYEHARYLIGRGAHYVFTVKGNQRRLLSHLKALPWKNVPVAHDDRETSHGRHQWRTTKTITLTGPASLNFPGATQALQITRRHHPTGSHTWTKETIYAITSLAVTDMPAGDLSQTLRGHWTIENALHWTRDVTFDEDRSQTRTANGPRIMATLRNLTLTILRLAGATNIAATLRHNARKPTRPLQTIKRL